LTEMDLCLYWNKRVCLKCAISKRKTRIKTHVADDVRYLPLHREEETCKKLVVLQLPLLFFFISM
jgi:hypothetical protein